MYGNARLHLVAALTATLSIGAFHPSLSTAAVAPSASTTEASATRQPMLAGVYRFSVGKVHVTALSDGTLPLDLHPLLKGISPKQIDSLLRDGFARNPLETSINAYVVDTGSQLVLVDTGAGELFGSVAGKLPRALVAAGYQPEQVSDILLTHIHTDHSGGLARAGRMMFPNATVHVGQADVDYFLDRANLAKGLEPRHLQEALDTVGPYKRAGKLKTFSSRSEILPGITAIPTPGHTPGHSFYRVESEGESIDFWGDIMHVGIIQFPQPDVTITFDVNQDAARAQRLQQFEAAAREKRLSAVAHLPFPGIGHIREHAGKYEWVPAEYRNRD
ncbi:MBL fold metallo-hydrolase [Metapseudomonas lalkuanensis]|uniref:MBL fold metallo-hydrolase n=1 Tax=Metapseudomonas lalkuanensis TaxID=2604832 RepID=A0A5J6QLD6_9GAMM|nr:MBL fold metallo-hydrolase [Pseudomonas lalkuanensis]QEY63233.1 MBL fold metallo-hydrolase [Pseudomonas lalkuanensis]UCP00680.1 MBL fold metallo-hydrolase [Pseudomonas lalkuanensis]